MSKLFSSKTKNLISIVIVNWNRKKFLEDCLKSIFANKEKLEVVVVDNGSTDGTTEFLKQNYPKVKIVRNKENLGFAEANNQGFDVSLGEYVLFLNNDTRVTTGFLKPLIKSLKSDSKIGGAQSKILLMEEKEKLDSIGAFFTNTGFLYHYGFRKKDLPKYNEEIYLYSAKGACMIFKREVLEKISVSGEIFDNKYFAYSEESDLCHRVWLAGYKIVYSHQSVIYHKVGETSKNINESLIQYHSFKNRINSYLKNLGVEYLIKILPIHLLLCLIASLSYLLRGKLNVGLAILRAMGWNITNMFQTIAQRKIIQNKIRKVSDEKFLPALTRPVGLSYFIAHLRGLENYGE